MFTLIIIIALLVISIVNYYAAIKPEIIECQVLEQIQAIEARVYRTEAHPEWEVRQLLMDIEHLRTIYGKSNILNPGIFWKIESLHYAIMGLQIDEHERELSHI